MNKNHAYKALSSIFCFFAINFSLLTGQKISLDQIKTGDIVDKKYAAFDIGEWTEGQQDAYHVKFIGNISDYQLIIFIRELPATPIANMENLWFFLLKDGVIINKRQVDFGREGSATIDILHDTFIQYVEAKHNWRENDVGIMDYDASEDYTGGLRFVVKDGEITSLDDLLKPDLVIYRNLIFAKYGYVFKSKELDAVFKATSWYIPKPGLKVTEALTQKDKELINHILKLESNNKSTN
jgi:hypothetical protein